MDTHAKPTASSPRRRPRQGRHGADGVRASWLPLLLLVSLYTALGFALFRMVRPPSTWFNWLLAVTWSLYFPAAVLSVIGAWWLQRRGRGLVQRSHFSGRTGHQIIFTVPSLCRSGTKNALLRVVTAITQHAPAHLANWRIDVVTEETADPDIVRELRSYPDVRVMVVPAGYSPPKGARFKARANQYALEARRHSHENGPGTYVYHLDDDTHPGEDTMASLAEFAEQPGGRYLLAQGILTFPRELTPSALSWYCDSIRPADDMGRIAFFTGYLGTPLGGLHGEHVIIRADIEDEIGWDYPDTVIEDAYFAMEFSRRYPGRSTTLNSFSYGASPPSVRELVKQRRRWSEGLLRLVFKRAIPWRVKFPLFYFVMVWMAAPVQYAPLVLLAALALQATALPPYAAIMVLWSVSLATLIWLYGQGLKFNMAASRKPKPTWWRSLLFVPGVYLFATFETYAALLGVIAFIGIGRQRDAEVIDKPRLSLK